MATLTITDDMQRCIDMQERIYHALKDELKQASVKSKLLTRKDTNPLYGNKHERKAIGHIYHQDYQQEAVQSFVTRTETLWGIQPGDHIEVMYMIEQETVHKFRCVYDGWQIPRGWGFEGKDEDGPYLKYHFAANPLQPQRFTPRPLQIIQITNRNQHLNKPTDNDSNNPT